ncbi:hypothetical protein NDN08_005043 [Rhodosorus marinus]|uniref:Flavin-containing monooxygenase n=1 Tax=Rhodosorus marinus TaxID=101924 RepID=A0AAV8V0D7_9RHOD|nr:hypothetical protein NDN08_005043 [Rhodosorus marinus]
MGSVGERVAIIGGGIAGSACCSAMRKRGLECVVFEKQERAGGLWVDNYYEATVQLPKFMYEYPEIRFGKKVSKFPSMMEVCEYVDEFNAMQEIQSCFRFRTKVKKAEKESDSVWALYVEDMDTGATTVEKFSWLVVCTGMFSSKPKRIKFLGSESFKGIIIHSSEYRSPNIFNGKKVVVIGGGKSGIDAARAASAVADEVVHVCRTRMWSIPEKLGPLPLAPLFLSRLGCWILPPYYLDSGPVQMLHTLFRPLKLVIALLMELIFLIQLNVPYSAWPNIRFAEETLRSNTTMLDEKYLDAVRNGKVQVRKHQVEEIKPSSVKLSEGSDAEADVIVLATGWEHGFQELFDKDIAEKVAMEKDGLYIYKNILPADIDRLAFVGSNIAPLAAPFTVTIQSVWLAQLVAGHRLKPTIAEMTEDIEKLKANRRRYWPFEECRGAVVQGHMFGYCDDLLQDMSVSTKRRGFMNWLKYWFKPNIPLFWKEIVQEAHVARKL